jgi:ABC-type antimicrobial peptide transport system permease subunit
MATVSLLIIFIFPGESAVDSSYFCEIGVICGIEDAMVMRDFLNLLLGVFLLNLAIVAGVHSEEMQGKILSAAAISGFVLWIFYLKG